MKIKIFITSILLLLGANIFANGAKEEFFISKDVTPIIDEYEKAVFEWDSQKLLELKKQFKNLLSDNSRIDKGSLLYYYGMVCTELLELSFYDESLDQVELMESGKTALEQSMDLISNFSDVYRALSAHYGLIIGIKGGATGATLGTKSDKLINKAKKLDPTNYRVYIEEGSNYYYTPEEWGGDKEKAIESFKYALSLNDRDDSIYLFLSRLYAERGLYDEAFSYAEKGYEINPNNVEIEKDLEELKKKGLKEVDLVFPSPSQGKSAYQVSLQGSLIQSVFNAGDKGMQINPLLNLYTPTFFGVEDLEFLLVFAGPYAQFNIGKYKLFNTCLFTSIENSFYAVVGGDTGYDDSYDIIWSYNESSSESIIKIGLSTEDKNFSLAPSLIYKGFMREKDTGDLPLVEGWQNDLTYGISLSLSTSQFQGLDQSEGLFFNIDGRFGSEGAGSLNDYMYFFGRLDYHSYPNLNSKVYISLFGGKYDGDDDPYGLISRESLGGGFIRHVSPTAHVVRGFAPDQFYPDLTVGMNGDVSYEFLTIIGGMLGGELGIDLAYLEYNEGVTSTLMGLGLGLIFTQGQHFLNLFSDYGFQLDSKKLKGIDIGIKYKHRF